MQPTMSKAQAIQQLTQMESELTSNLAVARDHKYKLIEAAQSAGQAVTQTDVMEAVKDVAVCLRLWIVAQINANESAVTDLEQKLEQVKNQLARLQSPIIPPQFTPPSMGGRS